MAENFLESKNLHPSDIPLKIEDTNIQSNHCHSQGNLKNSSTQTSSEFSENVGKQDPLQVVIPLQFKNIESKRPCANCAILAKKDATPTRLDLYKIFERKYPALQINQSPKSTKALRKALFFLLDLEEIDLSENQKVQIDVIVNNFCKFFSDPILVNSSPESQVQENATANADSNLITGDLVENLEKSDCATEELEEIHESPTETLPPFVFKGNAKFFSCHTCHRMFSDKCDLDSHQRVHAGEKPFSCEFCLKTFAKKSLMESHIRAHTGEKPFSCDFCGKRFSRKLHLDTHMRTHTGEKPFSCMFCGKGFTSKNELQIHIRRHTGEKPFSCELCGKAFVQRSDCQRHLRKCQTKIKRVCE